MKKSLTSSRESFDILETPLGEIYLIFSGHLLAGITFYRPRGMPFRSGETAGPAKRELAEYFSQARKHFSLETFFPGGSEFERLVWNTLREVPYGETRTYKWLADRIGRPRSCRAVGNALGKNPIPIIFPCHRIIESDGSLGGYSSGTDIKRRLIEMEYYVRQSEL